MAAPQKLLKWAEGIVYRAAGLPIALRAALGRRHGPKATTDIRRAYARLYWHPERAAEWLDILFAALIWVPGVLLNAAFMTSRNGSVTARRSGRSSARQFLDQLHFAARQGILPHWYYIDGLYERCRAERAAEFLGRAETKRGAYRILIRSRNAVSPLLDKAGFAAWCAERGVPTVPVLAIGEAGRVRGEAADPARLPERDLFLKPVHGRGGKGAERWDHVGEGRYRRPSGETLTGAGLIERLRTAFGAVPVLLQPRMVNHPDLGDLSRGALTTARVVTCLDESERPEIVGAFFRMAIGGNVVVDNLHAGGIAAAIDLATGAMLPATNLGTDARLGWLDRHPDTGAAIAGRVLPLWDDVRSLAVAAHRAFPDRVVVGWDVGILPEGPILVEGNSAPDVDIMQRPPAAPLGSGRFGELLAFHLRRCGAT